MSVERTDDERIEREMAGVVPGRVIENDDPDELGRVKVTFPRADAEDGWAPLATLMAGDEYGTYFLPEVDDEVLVAFEGGDPSRPYVVGSVWSETARPPAKNAGDNDVRRVESRSGHTITFDDDANAAKVVIETGGGHRITMADESGSERIEIEDSAGGNRIELDAAAGEVSIDAAQRLSLSAPEIEIEGETSVDVSSTGETSVSGDGALELSSSGQTRLRTDGLMDIEAAGPLTVKGALIKLN